MEWNVNAKSSPEPQLSSPLQQYQLTGLKKDLLSYTRTKSNMPDTKRTAELTPHLEATTVKAIHKTLKMLPSENAVLSLKLQLKSLEDDISNAINHLRQEKSCWKKTCPMNWNDVMSSLLTLAG
jgi:hypothetical protein